MNELIIKINVIVTQRNGSPCIELRRGIQEYDLMRAIIYCCMKDTPIVMLPQFSDKIKSLASLIEKGVIYHDIENNEYKFNI